MAMRDRMEAKAAIDRFLIGPADIFDWDDFTSTRAANKYVDAVRKVCLHVRDEFPPESGSSNYCNDAGYAVLKAVRNYLL